MLAIVAILSLVPWTLQLRVETILIGVSLPIRPREVYIVATNATVRGISAVSKYSALCLLCKKIGNLSKPINSLIRCPHVENECKNLVRGFCEIPIIVECKFLFLSAQHNLRFLLLKWRKYQRFFCRKLPKKL
jgi:hypothetical protein